MFGLTTLANVATSVTSVMGLVFDLTVLTDLTDPEPVRPKGHVLYAYKLSGHKNTFKVGKTVNLKSRSSAYKTLDPMGVVVHTVDCVDIHFAEKLLHMILKKHGHLTKREVFQVPFETLVLAMNNVATMSDKICSARNLNKAVSCLG